MKNRKTLLITLIITLFIMSILAVPALADAGSFAGNSEYGGSSGSSYSGSYSSSYSGSYGSSYGSSGDSSEDGVFGLGIILVVLFFVVFIFAKMAKVRAAVTLDNAQVNDYSQPMPIETLRKIDPSFLVYPMKEKISNLYVRMQNAWQANEFEEMRPFMTDALYNQFKLQLDELVRSGCTNHVERIAVLEVILRGWRTDATNDALIAQLQTRIIDYISNDTTGEVVSGSKTTEKFMTYEWTLIRSKGMTTHVTEGEGSENTVTVHCPSCGAPVEINQSAKCPYCDSVINSADYDWVISEIKGIAQRNGY